jgi:3-oxoacyl-[acyl-carrier-protein] synthase-3
MPRTAVIRSIGHYVPDKVLTNAYFESIVDTTDEWIIQRTGMKERHTVAEDQTTSSVASEAAKEALAKAGMTPEELDLIVCATCTPDMLFPSTACLVQRNIGAKNAGAFDVGAACAGFIHGLCVGDSLVKNGNANKVLVIGADALTRLTDYSDRSTCILFGDGGGAVVLEAAEDTDRGVITTVLRADGTGSAHIDLEVGGTRYPSHSPSAEGKRPFIYMNGNEVYRFAVKAMGDACNKALEQAGMHSSDVDLFVPHQANMRIIESAAKRLGLAEDKVFVNIHKYGNTSAGSIPLGLYEAEQEGRLKQGMIVMTVGFGAGLVWGANLIRW